MQQYDFPVASSLTLKLFDIVRRKRSAPSELRAVICMFAEKALKAAFDAKSSQ